MRPAPVGALLAVDADAASTACGSAAEVLSVVVVVDSCGPPELATAVMVSTPEVAGAIAFLALVGVASNCPILPSSRFIVLRSC
ncbi:hypothetical protein PF005_g9680 [Phytophthora fragariae]|uniref:Uncharacterized protein n=1 Tax=Phytophthora fragariae TaxID=53985 RepID=A0A6A3ERI2_9STRA|nr:hypothetical protein PF003_g14152 [Phytophthora fragariae]KAE8936094.1 hypothetical protein PF009_g13975 [Phytophthora fragariae]KAE9005296.1 hypothetical protein PF011_g12097 [Phytophthora fragariae]KAE9117509.1 hypothetical protein PF007_g9263 [Phytophthora fragariae]KAE9138315.1 hypothetical protein PF006_g13972 [Phytophthora fragariae]